LALTPAPQALPPHQALPTSQTQADRTIGYHRVAALLRQEILDGTAAPGTWLRMQAVALRCGVSVQPVREALQQLQGEGLVEMFPNRGAQVRGLDRVRLVHIYEMREALESFMARRFAEEATVSDLAALAAVQARHDTAVAAGDLAEVYTANRAFHAVITSHGRNQDVMEITARHMDLTATLVPRLGHGRAYMNRALLEHHALIAAFRRRDAVSASEIGASHVRATRVEILAFLDRTSS
jgi:DNA-binding GntR family transcriptional regulator